MLGLILLAPLSYGNLIELNVIKDKKSSVILVLKNNFTARNLLNTNGNIFIRQSHTIMTKPLKKYIE